MLAVLFLFSVVGAPKAVFNDGKHRSRQMEPWAAPAGWQRGSCPLCPMPCLPAAPQSIVVRKKYMCPLDPSHPLSRRKFYVKIHEMCQNTAQSILISFYFRSLTAKAPAASFPQLKVR